MYGFDGKNRYAHAGMLKSALGIRAELEANDVLGRIFNGHDSNLKTPLRDVRIIPHPVFVFLLTMCDSSCFVFAVECCELLSLQAGGDGSFSGCWVRGAAGLDPARQLPYLALLRLRHSWLRAGQAILQR